MPLYTSTETSEVEVRPSLVEPERDISTAAIYQNELVNDDVSLVSLEGTAWIVTYFPQILGVDDSPRQLDINLDPSLQQYIRIKKFVISFTGELALSTDTATNISTLSGEGQVYPGMVPNVGDMFVGTMTDGRVGIFVISAVKSISYLTTSAYTVEYKLFNYAENKYLNNLDIKTVRTVVFDIANVGCDDAYVDEEEVQDNVDSAQALVELVAYYYDQFYDLTTSTFLRPTEDGARLYDPGVTRFFNSIVGYELRDRHPKAIAYITESTEHRDKFVTIWDALINTTSLWKNRIGYTYTVKRSSDYVSSYMYNAVGTSHIDDVMQVTSRTALIAAPSTGDEEYYVFSENFYTGDVNELTKLEEYVLGALSGSLTTVDNLATEVTALLDSDMSKQFHHIPVLIWLYIKAI